MITVYITKGVCPAHSSLRLDLCVQLLFIENWWRPLQRARNVSKQKFKSRKCVWGRREHFCVQVAAVEHFSFQLYNSLMCAIVNKCTAYNYIWQTSICVRYKIKYVDHFVGVKMMIFFSSRNALLSCFYSQSMSMSSLDCSDWGKPGDEPNQTNSTTVSVFWLQINPLCHIHISNFSAFANFFFHVLPLNLFP